MTPKELGDAINDLRAGQQKILERIAVIETKLGIGGRFVGYLLAAILGGAGGMAVNLLLK